METKIEVTPDLKDFLERNYVLKQFIHNCEHHSRYLHTKTDIDIMGAFDFEATPEGHSFWWELAQKFENENPTE